MRSEDERNKWNGLEGGLGSRKGKVPQVMKRAHHVHNRARRRKGFDWWHYRQHGQKARRNLRARKRVRRNQHRQKGSLAQSCVYW